MRLRVTNLGPVREAEIDLSKPLIILTGPNNSGKTYVSWVVYSLARVKVSASSIPAGVQRVAEQLCEARDQSLGLESLKSIEQEILDGVAGSVTSHLASDFGAPKGRFESTEISLSETAAIERSALTASRLRIDSDNDFMLVLGLSKANDRLSWPYSHSGRFSTRRRHSSRWRNNRSPLLNSMTLQKRR